MKSINQVTLLGNLTKDPELRYTPQGNAVISFSIATNREWYDKKTEQKKEAVDFHSIVFWGKAAEILAQFVFKGNKLLVQGRIENRSWDDKSGVKHYKTEIIGNDFVLLGGNKPTAKPAEKPVEPVEAEPTEPTEAGTEHVNPDDIPF